MSTINEARRTKLAVLPTPIARLSLRLPQHLHEARGSAGNPERTDGRWVCFAFGVATKFLHVRLQEFVKVILHVEDTGCGSGVLLPPRMWVARERVDRRNRGKVPQHLVVDLVLLVATVVSVPHRPIIEIDDVVPSQHHKVRGKGQEGVVLVF